MRVVCEFCQTVYNIPDEKLVRDTSQATCKVCKNKIMIRRTSAAEAGAVAVTTRSPIPSSPSTDPTLPRVPTATPTQVSDAFPASPPSMATTEPSAPANPIGGPSPLDEGVPETELSNSWREAIVDNRGTVDLLRKTGVSVPAPAPASTEDDAEPTVAEPLPPPRGSEPVRLAPRGSLDSISLEEESGPGLEIATKLPPPSPRPAVRPAVAAAPRTFPTPASGRDEDARGSSVAIRLAGSFVSAAAAAALVHNGGWGLGLSGLAAIGACAFTAAALLLDSLLRRRGPIAAGAILVLAGLAAAGTVATLLATGGARTRALAAEHPFLAPFAALTTRGLPLPTPAPLPSATPNPDLPSPPDETPDEPLPATPFP